MKITIHEEKIAISHFTGKKKGRSRVTKIPFTTLDKEEKVSTGMVAGSFPIKRLEMEPLNSTQGIT